MRRRDAPFPGGIRSGEAQAPSMWSTDGRRKGACGTEPRIATCLLGVATSGFEVSSSQTKWALYRVFQSLQLFSCALFKTAFSSWCKKPPWAACGLQEELQKAARAAWVALGRATRLFAGRPWAGWLQRQTLVFSQFWRPEARGLGASRLDFFRGCFPRLVDGHLLHVASRGVFPARLGVPWCPSPS